MGAAGFLAHSAAAVSLSDEGVATLLRGFERLAIRDTRHGPLAPVLVLLTIVTGLVDAVSYLALGRTFVANMTGNVVFLGFAVADAADFSAPASLAAIAAFLVGALAGGRLAGRFGTHRGRLLVTTLLIETLLVGLSLALVFAMIASATVEKYLLITGLALAMGMQNAAARHLAVPDLTTTVLTLTLTGFAAESTLAGGNGPRFGRRMIATAAMFAGAAIGALVLLRIGTGAVLSLAFVLLLAALVIAAQYWSATEAWTRKDG
jgi:uncharacterized membrane protein YoaK (UPF0700 family)